MATPTLIDRETRLEGRIEGDEQVTVAGRVVGEIALTDALTVAQGGVIEGDVMADEVTIEGILDGTIEADGVVVLTETARVIADIRAAGLVLEDGAQLTGKIEVEGAERAESTRRSTTTSQRRSQQTSSRRSSSTTSSSTGSSSRSLRSTETETGRRPQSTATKTVAEESTASSSRTTSGDERDSESAADGGSEDSESESDDQADAGDADRVDESTSKFVDMSRDEISDGFTVRELRDELRDRDLTVRGKKAVLIDRLKDFVGSGD